MATEYLPGISTLRLRGLPALRRHCVFVRNVDCQESVAGPPAETGRMMVIVIRSDDHLQHRVWLATTGCQVTLAARGGC